MEEIPAYGTQSPQPWGSEEVEGSSGFWEVI